MSGRLYRFVPFARCVLFPPPLRLRIENGVALGPICERGDLAALTLSGGALLLRRSFGLCKRLAPTHFGWRLTIAGRVCDPVQQAP
jgi:hypothetical protein